jgi:DNA-binding Lrp family transcriptional regulator
MTDLARFAGVARGTAYARLDRLERNGVIVGYGPEVDPRMAGFEVLAFSTLEIAQGSHEPTTASLAQIPEILEVHTITGRGDILCRVAARSNDHLHDVIQAMTSIPSVRRATTQLALNTSFSRSAVDLIVNTGD